MFALEVHDYLRTFFRETNCDLLEDEDFGLTVQLTIDIDKKIMNRPFYWQYIETTGTEPNPARLTLITDRSKMENPYMGEIIHFGSRRLNQIFKATKELGSFVQMFEKISSQTGNRPVLTPYFCVNYKVSYYCDQTKESMYSLGINLINGVIKDNFHESISNLNLDNQLPDDVYCLPYIIKPHRGLERLDEMIQSVVQQDDHSWAEEARDRWEKEQEILDYFYEGVEEKPECYEIERKALHERFNPRINIEIINGGLFFLQ